MEGKQGIGYCPQTCRNIPRDRFPSTLSPAIKRINRSPEIFQSTQYENYTKNRTLRRLGRVKH